jgi:cytochrome c biogenesis protein ResB
MLLCIGPLLSFFGSHKKIWVNIHDRKGLAMVTVAGSANKNRLGFEHEFTRIVDEIGK